MVIANYLYMNLFNNVKNCPYSNNLECNFMHVWAVIETEKYDLLQKNICPLAKFRMIYCW